MKYKGVKIVFILLFLFNSNLFSQTITADTAVEVSCQFYLDTTLRKQVYLFADKKAEFRGGEQAMMQFIQSNLNYPSGRTEIFGTVFVEFVVDENGNIARKAIRRSVHKSVDEEALRVIDKLPKFIPAQCEGKAVPFLMVIPIKLWMK
jgi:TonB family protein